MNANASVLLRYECTNAKFVLQFFWKNNTILWLGSIWWKMRDNFGPFQPLRSGQALIPVSLCQVLFGCQFLSASHGTDDFRTAGGKPVCPLEVGSRRTSHTSSSSWLIKVFSCSSQYHFRFHADVSHPSGFDLYYLHHTVHCTCCDCGESAECPSPFSGLWVASILPNASQSFDGGWSAKPQSTSSRWQLSLWWLWSLHSVNNTWPGPAAHSNWGYIPGNTLMNN